MKIRESFRLYRHYIGIIVRGSMQYKASFFLSMAGQFLGTLNVILGVYFMFDRFHRVRDFSMSEVLLCFAIMLLQFSIAEMVGRGFDRFDRMIRKGTFDQVLVRPRSTILQVLGSEFELTRIGRMIQALLVFVYAVAIGDFHWTVLKILTVLLMLIGGVAVFFGLFMISASLCFFTVEGLEVINIFTDGARDFGRYPMSIYGKKLMAFATFIIPYTLIQYYPLMYILDRTDHLWYMFLPLVATLFLVPCYILWRVGVAHYQSTGS